MPLSTNCAMSEYDPVAAGFHVVELVPPGIDTVTFGVILVPRLEMNPLNGPTPPVTLTVYVSDCFRSIVLDVGVSVTTGGGLTDTESSGDCSLSCAGVSPTFGVVPVSVTVTPILHVGATALGMYVNAFVLIPFAVPGQLFVVHEYE